MRKISTPIEFNGMLFYKPNGAKYYGRKIIGKNGMKTTKSLHVYIWEFNHGCEIDSGWVVHHVDHNPLNNEIENLVAMTRAEHSRLHHDELSKEEKESKNEKFKTNRVLCKKWNDSNAAKDHMLKLKEINRTRISKKSQNGWCRFCGKHFMHSGTYSLYCDSRCCDKFHRFKGNPAIYLMGLA